MAHIKLKAVSFLIIIWFLVFTTILVFLFFDRNIESTEKISFSYFLEDSQNFFDILFSALLASIVAVSIPFSPKFKPDNLRFWFNSLWRTSGIYFLILGPLFLLMGLEYSEIACFFSSIGLIFIYIIYYTINAKMKTFNLVNIWVVSIYLVVNILHMIPVLLYDFKIQMFYSHVSVDRIKAFYNNLLFSTLPLVIYFFKEDIVNHISKSSFVRKSKISDKSIRKFIISICFGLLTLYILLHSIYLALVSS